MAVVSLRQYTVTSCGTLCFLRVLTDDWWNII